LPEQVVEQGPESYGASVKHTEKSR
jgi:hypothetical protein